MAVVAGAVGRCRWVATIRAQFLIDIRQLIKGSLQLFEQLLSTWAGGADELGPDGADTALKGFLLLAQ